MSIFAVIVAALLTVQTTGPVPVVLTTELGEIEIELDVAKAPITTANFLKYVEGGLFDGGRFHQTVRPDNQQTKPVKIDVIQGAAARERRAVDADFGRHTCRAALRDEAQDPLPSFRVHVVNSPRSRL